MRLGLQLRHSKELICLFDDWYCTRLWCVWELATYLKFRENPKVTFVCMSQCCCGVIMLLVFMVQTVATTAITETQTYFCPFEQDLQGNCLTTYQAINCMVPAPDVFGGLKRKDNWPECYVDPIQAWQNYLSLSIYFVTSIILASVGFIFGQRHFQNHERLRKAIAEYDIRTSQCASESDRDLLLRFVNDIFYQSNVVSAAEVVESNTAKNSDALAQSRVNAEQGLDAFNAAVRTTVPRHVSVHGLRRFKILPYIMAVLVPLQLYDTRRNEHIFKDPFWMYDHWAVDPDTFIHPKGIFLDYHDFLSLLAPWDLGWAHGTGNSFRYAMCYAYDRFILIPFGVYLFGVHVSVFMYLQQLLTKYTGLKYWITVTLLLPPFVVLECVCCFRSQIVNMIRSVTSMGVMQGKTLLEDTHWIFPLSNVNYVKLPPLYVPDFSSLRGLFSLMFVINAGDIDDAQDEVDKKNQNN